MRALGIDFQRRPRPHPAGWLLLLAGCALAVLVAQAGRTADADRQAQQARLARANAQLAAVTRPAALARPDPVLAAAREALHQARLPWDRLFAAFEAAQGEDVGLLTFAPEPARRQLRIEAEARNLAAMLAYQRLLQQQPGLAQVVLVDHSIMKDEPHTPVRFQLLAAWEVRHGQP